MSKSGSKKHYMNNEDLKSEIMRCKDSKVVSERLGEMFCKIVENVSRSFYWENKDDGEDCKANALFDLCKNFWKYEPDNGNAFAFCTQIAYFGIAGGKRILHPAKYKDTVSLTCIDEDGNNFEMYNL